MNPSPDDRDHMVLRERLGAYVLDGLDADERAEVDAHLATCATCRADLDDITPLARQLGQLDPDRPGDAGGPAPAPSPAGFAAILGRIRDEEAPAAASVAPGGPAPDSPVVPLRAPAVRTRLLVAASAAVLALAGLGAGFGLGLDAAEGPVEAVTVQAFAPGVRADAGTISHTWGTEVVLTATGFDAGRTYEVAVVDRTGRPVDAGAFVGTGTKEMVCRLNSSVLADQATGFVVTTSDGGEVLRSRFA